MTAAGLIRLPGFQVDRPSHFAPVPCALSLPSTSAPHRTIRMLDGSQPAIRFYVPPSATDICCTCDRLSGVDIGLAQNPRLMRFFRPHLCPSILHSCPPGTPQVKRFDASCIMLRPDQIIIKLIFEWVQGPAILMRLGAGDRGGCDPAGSAHSNVVTRSLDRKMK